MGVSRAQRFWVALGAVLVVCAVVAAILAGRPSREPSDTSVDAAPPASGSAGLGDPYYPDAGGGGYDVQRYDVRVRAGAPGSELRGTTTVTAVATQDLDWLHLDLLLSARSATVNGHRASIDQRGDDLSVLAPRADPAAPAIRGGSTFTVTIEYDGVPAKVQRGRDPAYYQAGDEFVIAGEPFGASLWYPANDHPRDAATMTFTVSVPEGVEAVCAGRLLTHGADESEAGRERWRWQVDAPTVTYATFLAVGQYRLQQGVADGRPFVYAVSERLSASDQRAALRWLGETPAVVKGLEKYLGPYPFSGIGGFVGGADFVWGGLETAMRPVYNKQGVGSRSLLAHEMAHMWFGDTVTLTEWNDLFNNESLASYAEWLTSGENEPSAMFSIIYHTDDDPTFWTSPLADPGRAHLFERVYDRGPTAVHALRTRMGDEAFFAMLRSWAQRPGARSLEDFRRHADEATPEDLSGLFREWLDEADRPAATKDNGVKG